MSINVLTDRQRCARKCPYTAQGSPDAGDVRQCAHGKWWVATGRRFGGSYLNVWRRATWFERRRIRRFMTKESE